jgi:hypothetical protein
LIVAALRTRADAGLVKVVTLDRIASLSGH